VHCRSGYRAVIAASLLQAAGHAVVAIDDEYIRAPDAGLSLVTGTAAARRHEGLARPPVRVAAHSQRGAGQPAPGRDPAGRARGPEWRAGHAPGARHIPLSRLPARMKDLPPRRTVVTVCRFALGAKMLAREGREVINLSGGMHVHAAGP